LTHAAIYDYRLEPGDIDIIIALTRAIYDYRLEPVDIDIIIALTHA
jgi:3-oxoacyl-[acyl-carrier-protein] synthase III